jgi:CMP/dCMP kinase
VIKNIVFTGGPCSGKTQMIQKLKEKYEYLGYQVLIVSETATELINCGMKWWDKSLDKYYIQEAIFKLQLEKENVMKELATKYNNDVIIFYDRGLLDGKGYIESENYEKICFSNNLDINKIYMRYDVVLHLDTISKLDAKMFNHDSNSARKSNVEQSISFNQSTFDSWKEYPNFHHILAEEHFDNKIKRVNDILDIELIKGKIPITISGNLGSGKSTVGQELAKYLNFNVYQIGDLMRILAKKNGMDINDFNIYLKDNKEIDSFVNDEIIKISNNNPRSIFISRIAWYLIPDSFKVYLHTEENVAVKRILSDNKRKNEVYYSADEALSKMKYRFENSRQRFIENYNIDIIRESNYDLYVDTTNMTITEVRDLIIESYLKKHYERNINYEKILNNNRYENKNT